ncbi:MAG TPA: hypothetical protein VF210_18700 [Pseudomonadales bacterium]
MPEVRMPENADPSAEDDLAGMAGVFNGLVLAVPFYLMLLVAWWVW